MDEFLRDLYNDIKVDALENMCSTREAFFKYACSTLIDVGEIQDFNECYFSNYGRNRRKILIDGYYYDPMMKELVIIVASYEEENYTEILSKSSVDNLFKAALAFLENRNLILEKGEDSSTAFQFADYLKYFWDSIIKIKVVIVSNQVLSSSKKLKNIKSTDFEGKDVSYSIWGADRFKLIHETSKSHEKIVIDVQDFGYDGIVSLEASNDSVDYEAYLTIVPGELLAQLYDSYGSRLLEGNVRAFLQNRGKVNKEIRGTLLREPEMFFAYNNGIAATATHVKTEVVEGKLYITELEDLQIVNGGQTTASIFNIKYVEKVADLRNVFVPMKLSIVDDEKAETLIPIISKTANTQNKVSAADFFSNHPFHRRIEQLSRKLYAPAVDGNQYTTTWFYERSRGQYRSAMMKMTKSQSNKFKMVNPKNQVITKTDLAKYHNSWKGHPDIVSLGAQRNFMNFAGKVSNQWGRNNAVFNQKYYKNIICNRIMFKELEKLVSSSSWYQNAFRANIVTYTLALFYNKIQTNYKDKIFDIDHIWRNQQVPSVIIRLFETVTYDVFVEITKEAPNRTRNVTEWCKKIECWNEMKKSVNVDLFNIERFLKDKSKVKDEEKEEIKEQRKINKLNMQVEVVNKGSNFWKEVLDWGVENKYLFGFQYNIVKIAANMEKTGLPPSEKQSKTLMEILKKLELEGLRSN